MRWWAGGLLVAVAAGLLLGLAASASAVPVPFEEGFEGVPINSYPSVDGWICLQYGKSAYVSNSVPHTGSHSFRLDSWPWMGRTDYVRLDRVPDTVGYEASVCVDALKGRLGVVGFVQGFTSPGPMWNAFTLDARAKRVGFLGASYVDLAPYTPGTWCTVRADLNFRTLKADLWVNKALVAQQVGIAPKQFSDPALGQVTLNQWGVNSSSNYGFTGWYTYNVVYFDDLKLWEWKSLLDVEVDVKPGEEPNPINLRSRGLLPVAIFSSQTFDATTINCSSLRVGGAPIAYRGRGCMAHEEDVDGDGLLDLVVQVETRALDREALKQGLLVVTGQTCGGEQFEGSDEIILVPARFRGLR